MLASSSFGFGYGIEVVDDVVLLPLVDELLVSSLSQTKNDRISIVEVEVEVDVEVEVETAFGVSPLFSASLRFRAARRDSPGIDGVATTGTTMLASSSSDKRLTTGA